MLPHLLLAVLVLLSAVGAQDPARLRLASPDGRNVVEVTLTNDGAPRFAVRRDDHPIASDCGLGLALADAPALRDGFEVTGTERTDRDATWRPVYGERSEVRDHHRELALALREARAPHRRLGLVFRAYDDGIAFCYEFPHQDALRGAVVTAEETTFRFAGDHRAWPVYSAQGEYAETTIDKIATGCERPLTIEVADDLWVALGEARLVDFSRMKFGPVADSPHTLRTELAGPAALPASTTTPYRTPWRFMVIAERPGGLLQANDLLLNLNDPCAIEDTSWIRPGKVIREITLTTAGGKACVDFAVERGIAYVHFDAGWYGHEYHGDADATTVTRDEEKSGTAGDLDLHEVIRYARERGVGITLYVNRRALERQLDELLPLYRSWGVAGVKYGFVQVGDQRWTTWLHDAVRKAAAHRLMVDVHDEYRPTGYSRTYPNLMTQEGVRGNECMPSARDNAILPFTRFVGGAADCTICWYDPRVKTSRAHQLATAVVFYSPWQFVYWYDRPAQYAGEPELEFLDHVPVVWDETRVLSGQIGEFVAIARRRGDEWFLGTLNAGARRRLELPLGFLTPDTTYRAHVYEDAAPEQAGSRDAVVRHLDVDSATRLVAELSATGGQAVRLVPVR